MEIFYFVFGAIALILIPFTPQWLRLRVRILRKLHWNWAANFIESNFTGFTLFARIVLFAVAAVLCFFGWTNLQN